MTHRTAADMAQTPARCMTDDLRKQIIAAYQAGQTLRAIAEHHRISSKRVFRVVSPLGISRSRGRKRLPLEGRKRDDYIAVRVIYGAAYAREAFGLC